MKITLNDLKRAITCYGDVSAFIPALSNITGKPPLNIISRLEQPAVLPEPDTLIQYTNPELALLLNKIINIKSIKPVQNNIDIRLVQVNNNEKSDFIAATIKEIHPDIITIDVSSLNFSINLLYAFSMLSVVGLPVYAEVFLKNNRNRYTIETIYPNDTIQIVLIESWLHKIPLVPVNIPFSTNYSAINHIVRGNLKRTFFDDSDVPASEEVSNIQNTLLAEEIYSDPNETIFSSQQEISIQESSYIASRVFDISSAVNNGKQKKLLVFLSPDHYKPVTDFLALIKNRISEDTYEESRNGTDFSQLEMICKSKLELYFPGIKSQNKSKFQQLFILELDRLSSILQDKQLSIDQADIIITELVQRTRENRDIKRGVSVRGTIALREVLNGFKLLDNQISLKNIEKSALVTLPNRITPRRGGYESAKGIITDIIKEMLYGIRFSGNLLLNSCISDNLPSNPCDKMPSIARIEPKQLEEGKNKEEQRKDDTIIVKAGSKTDNNKKQSISGSPFSEPKNENLQVSTTDDYMKDLTQMLEQQRCLSEGRSKGSKTSQGKASTSPGISSKDLANTTLEMMDAKDRQWQKELDFNDIYMYYHLKQNQDGLVQPKQNYDYLKVIINNLLEKGILQFSTTEDNYLITYQALDLLLEQLISKEIKGKALERLIGRSNENIITSRESTRRYRAGDNFRDISIRHTLRQIVRNGKQLSTIDKGDFKIYTKEKHRVQSDIALCIDSSSSMGYQQNLLLARIVAAGLIKAAIVNGNEVGITTFDDVSKTIMPLTSRQNDLFDHIMKINAGGNTNIGDGIKGSAEMLLKTHNQNQKFIVLITDGQSTAISDKAFGSLKPVYGKVLAEEAAIIETRRAASRGIKTSVIYITDSRNEKYAFIKNIAIAGRGIVNVVRSIEDLRLMMR